MTKPCLITRAITLSPSLLIAALLNAQPAYSLVLDSVLQNQVPKNSTVVCSDGSSLHRSRSINGSLLRRSDAIGNISWNKWYPATGNLWESANNIMAADGSGGFYMAHLPYASEYTENTWDVDTAVGRLAITHMEANGTVLWRSDLERTITGWNLSSEGYYPTGVSLAVHDAGQMYALVEHLVLPPSSAEWHLVALNASDGSVLWVRDISDNGGSMYTDETMLSVACMSNGDVIVGRNHGPSTGDMLLARISTSGDLLWMNEYSYINGATSTRFNDFTISPTGKIVALGQVALPGGTYLMLFHIDGNGTLVKGELVSEEFGHYDGDIGIGPDGKLVCSVVRSNGPLGVSSIIYMCDTLGSPVQCLRFDTPVIGAERVSFAGWSSDILGQQLVLSGVWSEVDTMFATTSRRPAIIQLDANALAHCMASDSVLPSISIPAANLSSIPFPDGASAIPIFPYQQAAAQAAVLFDVPPLAELDLCGLVISVEEATTDGSGPLLWPQPVHQASLLNVEGTKPSDLMIFDATGRVVMQFNDERSARQVDTSSLEPGTYFAVGRDPRGARLWSQLFVVL